MSPTKPANPVLNYAVGSAIAALILLGPVAALLMVIATEMLIDLLIVGGTSAVCAVAAGSIGLRSRLAEPPERGAAMARLFYREPAVGVLAGQAGSRRARCSNLEIERGDHGAAAPAPGDAARP